MQNLCFFVALAVVAVTSLGQDLCTDGNHEILRDARGRRSSNFHIQDSALGRCDVQLLQAWYRVESPAGTLMPTYPVTSFNCSTTFPIWLNGTHPDATEGQVNRSVCATGLSIPCQETFNIGVVNCTDFMLYHLSPPSQCDTAYCFGDRFPCPPGYQSTDGFQPGCEPIPTTEPISKTGNNSANSLGPSSCSPWFIAASSLVLVSSFY